MYKAIFSSAVVLQCALHLSPLVVNNAGNPELLVVEMCCDRVVGIFEIQVLIVSSVNLISSQL